MNLDHESCVIECVGCNKVCSPEAIGSVPMESIPFSSMICSAYWRPESKWLNGKKCPLSSNLPKEKKAEQKMLDPIKANKRKIQGK